MKITLHWFEWSFWRTVWHFASNISSFILWPLRHLFIAFASTTPKGDQQHQNDEEQRLNSVDAQSSEHIPPNITIRRASQRPDNHKLLIIGIFAEVYLLDDKIIRKIPRSQSEEDRRPIIREAMIYGILGTHARIAEWLSRGISDYIDIKYYPYGDLVKYCQENSISPELRSKWYQQILEAVIVIHSYGIIHSDLALRQFFIDDNLDLRLGDFNSSQCPGHISLGYEKASHCLPRDYELPNTEISDIFALGSTLYELVAGEAPYSELSGPKSEDPDIIKAQIRRQHLVDHEIEALYKTQNFPDVSNLFRGEIILGCWIGEIRTAQAALDLYLKHWCALRIC
ncbi:uncharacterized protein N7479_002325 [Penicillium vulpinum]|uniref:Protein kinase domain-containing protein n=1 Tax=Penicillium vulpinum TaxID=29845 RepID=A0A1V6S822_9EURO|nr:uncharacterized protein N7479_002325 [Penicillium vulpinum]KAJ5972407.1 hypothetical protein N7479_002325 [Penicillium vulpinum]OQE09854.1 hypothetical protein PENVUL_c005G01699 [Penicillium vulpinum]